METFQKSYQALGKPIEISLSCKKVIWILTTPLHRSSCFCQIAVFHFCFWSFWAIFGNFPDWLAIGARMFAELEKIFYKLHRLIFCQEFLAAPITNKLKKKWLNNTKHHFESGIVDLDTATKALLGILLKLKGHPCDTQLWDRHHVFLQLIRWTILRNTPKDLWFWLTASLI